MRAGVSGVENGRVGVHPLITVLLSFPAMVAVLAATNAWFLFAVTVVCLVTVFFRGVRTGLFFVVVFLVLFIVLWLGMSLWMLQGGAVSGALRIIAVSYLFFVPLLFVDYVVLADTLISRFRVPYTIVDAVVLGGRFVVFMRQDVRMVQGLLRLRTVRRPVFRVRLWAGGVLAALVASFRHSEFLAIAMDARGFGVYRFRTVRFSRCFRVFDFVVLAVVWGGSVFSAVFFAFL